MSANISTLFQGWLVFRHVMVPAYALARAKALKRFPGCAFMIQNVLERVIRVMNAIVARGYSERPHCFRPMGATKGSAVPLMSIKDV